MSFINRYSNSGMTNRPETRQPRSQSEKCDFSIYVYTFNTYINKYVHTYIHELFGTENLACME